jgi:hypothetical protein
MYEKPLDVLPSGKYDGDMNDVLTAEEHSILLGLARQAIQEAAGGIPLRPLRNIEGLPVRLLEPGATFVTLTRRGELRGCIGALESYQPLVEDVREHAVAAATQDPRFPPVRAEEIAEIEIEISRLTAPKELEYGSPEDLIAKLHPDIDGVILRDGWRRATFLPQVWQKIPDPPTFLSYLCQKMGASSDLWRSKKLQVQTYQVEEFHD